MNPEDRPSRTDPPEARTVTRDALPALASFLGGYLHQDFLEEHGSAEAAARAFRRAAGEEESQALARDLDAFERETRGLSIGKLRRLLVHALGSAWVPASRTELARIFALLKGEPEGGAS